ncbi:Protein R53.4 [Aphelenchoides avenae]|nr:Protein R53.4 [Aphelenchus avenae]
MSLSRSVVISKRLSSEVGHHGPKRVASMRDYLFKPTAPPNTELRPWIPEVVFIPIERAVERLGVYFYNRVIHPSEMGLFHKAYNPRVHGPYCHHRWVSLKSL